MPSGHGGVERWREYWVSERDVHGDIIAYTAQTFAAEKGQKEAKRVFADEFVYDNAVSKVLEQVDSVSADAGWDLDREYKTLSERQRSVVS